MKRLYAQPQRGEFAGNPLASWLGVPIFCPKAKDMPVSQGVLGVIAVYHPTLEYVYSIRDLFFLQAVAAHISGLFRILENTDLKESNRKLEEAKQLEQKLLLEESARQEELAKTFILIQLKNKVADSILDLERAINFSIDDIGNYQRFKEDTSLLRDTLLLQKDAMQSVTEIKQAIKDTSLLDISIKEPINISSLFENIIQELDGYQYLIGNIEQSIEFLANRENCYIAIFNFLRSIIGFLQKVEGQAEYKIYKYKKGNSIFIDIDINEPEALFNELKSSIIIVKRRIGADIFLHEKNTIRFSIDLNGHEERISIIGGKTVDKRTLQDTLSKLGEKSKSEDDINSESHSKVIFILDNRKIDNKFHNNAKIVSFSKENGADKVIDKTRLDNEDYLRSLLKDIKYYD
ncbi:GAF domain-containing protein [Thiothrix nivea]|uniref:GAF domain-containing protein n=1 Tax=Thiothrix nivea TaxID=1031 RepID=UPI0003090CC8|nr:hypothetical protein [Thiothrix nivea]